MGVEFVHRGQASGSVAARLLDHEMDLNAMRLYRGAGGHTYMDKFVGNDDQGNPVHEAVRVGNDSVIPWEVWRDIDRAVVETARPELRVIADLQAAGLSRNIDAMSVAVIGYQKRSESAQARVVMDPAVRARRDRGSYGIENTPVPFIESEWSFNLRELNMARRGGVSLDLDQIRYATRVVMETAEDMVLGNVTEAFTFNGYSMPGILNFADANTQVLSDPTQVGWEPEDLYNEINAMRQKSIDDNFPGPWVLYFGYQWDTYLNRKYASAFQSDPLRMELLKLDGIQNIRILRRLSGYKVILMQMTESVFRLYNGLPLRAIQWDSPDGFIVNGKIITSIVPQPRSDAAGQCGIVIGNIPA